MFVFVYGTLKKGYSNSRYLKGCRFISNAQTFDTWIMRDSGFPVLTNKNSSEARPVLGEVYEINQSTLHQLDTLEGFRPLEPEKSLFVRVSHKVLLLDGGHDGQFITAQYYIGKNPSFLEREIKPLVDDKFVYTE